jgi:hypothetical protein
LLLGSLECYLQELSKCSLDDALKGPYEHKTIDVGNMQNIMSVCTNDAASFNHSDRVVFIKSRPWQMHNDSQPVYNGTTVVVAPADRVRPLGGAYYYLHAPGRKSFFDHKVEEDHALRSGRKRKRSDNSGGLDLTSQFQVCRHCRYRCRCDWRVSGRCIDTLVASSNRAFAPFSRGSTKN